MINFLGDLSCYGATKVHTPNIDRLASEGVSFTDAHAAAAVCSPSRYGLITGRYPLRRNLWGALIGLEDGFTRKCLNNKKNNEE